MRNSSLVKRLCAGAAFAALASMCASAQVALPQPVEQTALARDAFATGTLTPQTGALGADLWRGADLESLALLLDAAPALPAGPSLGEALRRTLLSPGDAPAGAGTTLAGKKLLALTRAGHAEEARTIASLSSAPRGDASVGQALALADMLEGKLGEACRRNAALTAGRDAPFWVKLRVLCYAQNGERDAADLTLGLLREQGALSDVDDALLTALAAATQPKTALAPENAFHLAALRQLSVPLAPGLLGAADAGVLEAIAFDASLDAATRASAAVRAAAAGAMSGDKLAALYQGLPADVAEIAGVAELVRSRPNDPLTDVLLYRSVAQMTAPEFLRDKAARIAEALSIASTFERAYASSLLYADEIKALEGALATPAENARFALARLAVGDAPGAERWLGGMISGGLGALEEGEAMEFIELTRLLALLDPAAAARVSDRAGTSLDESEGAPLAEAGRAAPAFPMIVDAAFDAALGGAKGQAALAALAASDAAPGDAVGEIVVAQSLRAAGLDGLRRRMALEAALRARYAAIAPSPADAAAPAAPAPEASAPEESGLAPRLKPQRPS